MDVQSGACRMLPRALLCPPDHPARAAGGSRLDPWDGEDLPGSQLTLGPLHTLPLSPLRGGAAGLRAPVCGCVLNSFTLRDSEPGAKNVHICKSLLQKRIIQ